MSGLPKGYGYKDLTSLGKAWHENEILQKKLDIAIDALEHLESAVWSNNQESAEEVIEEKTQIAHDTLIKIHEIK